MRPARIVLLTATALAALYGAGLYAEQMWAGPSCCGLTWPTPDAAQAERFAGQIDPQLSDPALQRRTALKVLAAHPLDGAAWLRLSAADMRAHAGRLTPEGRHALEMSYLVLPYASAGAAQRVAFTLNAWSQVSPHTREDAIREARIGDTAHALAPLLVDISDPQGQDKGLDLAFQ
jgi:hypothetical protein